MPPKGEEPRACLVAMEMLHRGDFVVPRVLGEPELDRPPLHPWALALFAAFEFEGVDASSARALTLAALAGIALLLWRLGSARTACAPDGLPVLIFLSTGAVVLFGRSGEADLLFCLLNTAALGCFELGRRQRSALLQWCLPQVWVAAGFLTHGLAPVLFYPPVLWIAWRRRHRIRFAAGWFLLGTLLALLIVSIWLVPYAELASFEDLRSRWNERATGLLTARGPTELLGDVVRYPLLLLVVSLPWSLAPFAAGGAARAELRRQVAVDPYAGLAAAVVCWVAGVHLLAPGAGVRGLLPALPFASVLIAALLRRVETSVWPVRILLTVGLVLGALVAGVGERRQARQAEPWTETALELARSVEPGRPVMTLWTGGEGRQLAFALGQAIERPLRAHPPASGGYDLVAPEQALPPAGPVELARAAGFTLWRFEPWETRSPDGRPLVAAPLDARVQVVLERRLAEARAELGRREEDAPSLIWVGRRTAYLGRYREAVAIYSYGLARHPESHKLRRHRGHRFITLRDFDAAVEDLAAAAALIADRPDEVEPDGLPNAANIPRSTSHTNIWYHLGLARFLQGDFARAARCYARCLELAGNDDMDVAARHWLYMTLRREGRADEAARLLEAVDETMEILENRGYHELLLLYKGLRDPELLWERAQRDGGVELATLGFGLGQWHHHNGRRERAEAIYRRVSGGASWAAFGHIAAEVELARAAASGARRSSAP